MTERFEVARPRLLRIAHRILGSHADAEDALQESFVRVARSGSHVGNVDGYLTTIVARVCFDKLEWRQSRREDLMSRDPREASPAVEVGDRPEDEAMRADAIGVALRILIDALAPAERVAFVLHDLFDVPFDDVAPIVGRTPEAARQLASRARRRVRGAAADRDAVTQRHDELVRAFLAASRMGNIAALLALLDPSATLRADEAVLAMGGAAYWELDAAAAGVDGARAVAQTFSKRAQAARAAFIDGAPGAVWMQDGALRVAFRFRFASDRIVGIDLVADPAALARFVVD